MPIRVPPGGALTRGATVLEDRQTRFWVWAPRVRHLAVRLTGAGGRVVPLARGERGVFTGVVADVGPGADYLYVLDEERERPDPVSRWQPHGVHGPSRVVDPRAFRWEAPAFAAPPLERLVIYEVHVGTFTPDGTFAAAAERLPHLRSLGANAVELMPVAEFPGGRNWGYDGAHLYAPQSSYGGPDGLRRLVDACHRQGLAVILDVVYNHFGPEGTYLGEFGPYVTDRHRTPWGDAVNYDGPGSDEVRRHVVENALYWQREYRVDGLRLDAVHGIFDFGARHVLEELTAACHEQASRAGRPFHVIAESDLNDPRLLRPVAEGGYDLDAQWHDDFHHAAHALLTGRRHGYLVDYGRLADLAKALTEGFVLDGGYSAYRDRAHGRSARDRPGRQFVAFTQNHDQIANAAGGVRLTSIVEDGQDALAATLLLTAPYVPLLFMGQDWGEEAPFHYFTSVGDPALAAAIRAGRQREMAALGVGRHGGAAAPDHGVPDPQAGATFAACRLRWDTLEEPRHAATLRLYRDLLRLRREVPALGNCRKELCRAAWSEPERWLILERGDPAGPAVAVLFNFSPTEQWLPVPAAARSWRRLLWTRDPRYGGPAGRPPPPDGLAPAATLRLDAGAAAVYQAEP